MSVLRSFFLFFLGLALLAGHTYGQKPSASKEILKAVQPGYFMFPIMPGEANSLSGGLGDLRANHFHAGLDIRTQQREGLDVHAAADGYVARIAVFTGGYGNVVFIKHPNGLTTVYGHLKVLNDTLQRYLRAGQYAQKTFEIDLRPSPNQFPVKKGEIIALSGNTGGSGGPHLHFEIRDGKDNLLNPLLFGFNEIEDNTPPFFERLAIQPLTPGSRVNGQVGRLALTPVRRNANEYALPQPVSASGLLGLEVLGFDKVDGSPFKNGLSCVEIRLDGDEVFAYNMDYFPNEQTHEINVHMNYAVEQLTGQRFHRCYLADGNKLSLYSETRGAASRGKLPLLDSKPHEVSITIYDAAQHSATLRFTVQPETTDPVVETLKPVKLPTAIFNFVEENTLVIRARNFATTTAPTAQLYLSGANVELPVSYIRANEAYYIVDLNKYLPDSVRIGATAQALNYRKHVIPGQATTFQDSLVTVTFAPNTLYDTLHLAVSHSGNRLDINQFTIPLSNNIQVDFKPTEPVEDQARTQVYMVSAGRRRYVGGYWKNDRIEFHTNQLGSFQLLTDKMPPVVKLIRKDAGGLAATIKDDLSGIDKFRALVNGEWVLMQYDYKRNLIWSDKLDPTQPFEGEVIVQVKDRAGNVTTVTAILPPAPATVAADSLIQPNEP